VGAQGGDRPLRYSWPLSSLAFVLRIRTVPDVDYVLGKRYPVLSAAWRMSSRRR
jgi:hypothetical protein